MGLAGQLSRPSSACLARKGQEAGREHRMSHLEYSFAEDRALSNLCLVLDQEYWHNERMLAGEVEAGRDHVD